VVSTEAMATDYRMTATQDNALLVIAGLQQQLALVTDQMSAQMSSSMSEISQLVQQSDVVKDQMKHANNKVDMFELRFNQIEQFCQGFEDMQSKIKDEVIKHMGAIPNLSEDVSKLMKASYGLDVPKIVKDEVVKHMEAIPNIANEVTELMKSAKSMDIPK
jgi:tRNA U34 5-carboxymethylaminomethyl modifying enzyme MnmG/GidA